MNSTMMDLHIKRLDFLSPKYDEKEKMLALPYLSHGYHTKLTGGILHPVREAFQYAAALLAGGREEDKKRAYEILYKGVSLQDKDEKSKTYGLWSYYLEEPLDEMAPPDYNWANFCGKMILQILLDYRPDDEELARELENSLRRACECIIRRNMDVQYTNIAVMDSYMTVAAGELFSDERLISYGRKKLKRFLSFTESNNDFYEYNSPMYTMIVIKIASLMLRYIKDETALSYAKEVNDIAWRTLSLHFHAPTGRWAGPSSRSYSDFLSDINLTALSFATGIDFGRKKEVDELTLLEDIRCPEEYKKYFREFTGGGFERKMTCRGFTYPYFAFTQIASSYMSEKFTLGTFNKEELWNQRRPFLCYVKTASGCAVVRIRALHDFYDFSSAQLHASQNGAEVLGVIDFATNRGDTHLALDKVKNSTIHAKDFRIRFSVEGDIDGISCRQDKNRLYIKLDGTYIYFDYAFAVFGKRNLKTNLEKKDNAVYFDLIISDVEEDINFKAEGECAAAFSFAIDESDRKYGSASASSDGEFLTAQWNGMEVKAFSKADIFEKLMLFDEEKYNGNTIDNLAQEGIM